MRAAELPQVGVRRSHRRRSEMKSSAAPTPKDEERFFSATDHKGVAAYIRNLAKDGR
jgi:hypothetical protein